ncbi:MAG: cyclic nucleotide-binding domain-containing protein [Pseudomonadota bacterium]
MEKKVVPKTGKVADLIIDFLIDMPIFDNVVAQELKIVASYMNIIDAEPGEILFKEGDKGDYVCFIVEGILEIIKKTVEGKNVVISTLSKGRSIGEMSVIDQSPRSASVRAKTKATLITLSQDNLNLLLEEDCKVGAKIVKGISRLLSMNMRKTSSRLADYLLPLG